MLRLNALAALLVAAAVGFVSEPAFAAGRGGGFAGGRVGITGGGFRAPLIVPRVPARAGVLQGAPRPIARPSHGMGLGTRAIPAARRALIPPSARGYATTTPLRPFAGLSRRSHRAYYSGWYFPTTIGDDYGYSYIGTPYDPSEAIPVYGPSPYDQAADQADPAPPPAPVSSSRVTAAGEENRDACRAEKVTVPAAEGERAITVVRC